VRRKQRQEWAQGKRDRKRIALNAQQGAFVYFALHYEPEASTSAAGGEFNSQLDALCALSALLPAGWRILVKENPQQGFLHRSAVFYERIRLIPNIAFVDDDCPSQDLLERAQVVATISGTVGFGAMLAGRACSHFGTPWYAGLPGAIAYHARLDLTLHALQRVQKPELDAAINKLLSQSANGIIAPRFAHLLGPEANWASYADITARSLAAIAALAAPTETSNILEQN